MEGVLDGKWHVIGRLSGASDRLFKGFFLIKKQQEISFKSLMNTSGETSQSAGDQKVTFPGHGALLCLRLIRCHGMFLKSHTDQQTFPISQRKARPLWGKKIQPS